MIKKVIRMVVFSALAIYLTSLWNKGFSVNLTFYDFLKASLIIALVYYLITPLTKIILLPLNILTLGLVSVLAYVFIFYLFTTKYQIMIIEPWVFPGFTFLGLTIQKLNVSYLGNIVLSAFSISTIINSLEKLI